MKALIIGAAGFVGPYLIEAVKRDLFCEICAAKSEHHFFQRDDITVQNLNILDEEAVEEIIRTQQPDYIFNLAAQSSIARSWADPTRTVDVNIMGALNILNAARKLPRQPGILLIGSGEEYGMTAQKNRTLQETDLVFPQNIYAATKACQNMIGSVYSSAYGMRIISVRSFNHIGPGQADKFVVSDFCHQVARIEAGEQPPEIYIGNLKAERDFTDVRDVVRAYTSLVQFGETGETYNVGTGRAITIESVLQQILAKSTKQISVVQVPEKMRPIDVPTMVADVRKLTAITGWKPEYALSDTLDDMLSYWRAKCGL